MRFGSTLAGIALLVPGGAIAQDRIQPWPTLLVVIPATPKWSASVETIGRLARVDDKPSQLELRLELGRAISKQLTLWVGYVHVSTYRPGIPTGIENQIVEQANWRVGTFAGITASSRTRLEQRFIQGADKTAWRLREQVRLTLPLKKHGPALVLWTEPFVALNHTSATQTTFDQIRSFAGISIPLSPRADIELGYLNQHLHRASGDAANDVIPVVLNMHF
jgi:hypothetical protein